ncbi:MAG: HAD-IB family hydrolase [Bacteroidia bacterium]
MNTIKIAAFDFDGTITIKDTMFSFLKFVKGKTNFWLGMIALSPVFALYALKIYSNRQAKEKLLTYFLGGMTATELYAKGQAFDKQVLPSLIRPLAMEKIAWHHAEGHRCYLVSASLTFWLKSWAESNGFELVATLPEIENDVFTGKIADENCHGQEKVNRLKTLLNPKNTYEIFAYGDSSGDKELLAWANHAHYQPFR